MHMYRTVASLCLIAILATACGANQRSEAEIRSTVQAETRATDAALAQQQREGNLQATNTALEATIGAQAAAPTLVATAAPTSAPTNAATTAPLGATSTGTTTAATSNNAANPVGEGLSFGPASSAPQQVVNIELVFDASGSMAESAGNNETRIQAARRAMEQIIATLPDGQQNLNVGFRVFGHKGDNTEAKKAESCASTDLYVPLQGVNKQLLSEQAQAYAPTGWTPITLAIQKAGEDMTKGENVKNQIILVTDGEETCNGDPCAVSKALADSGAQVRIDVVGFGLTPSVASTLKCIGENTGGSYTDAQNGDALVQSLQQLIESTVQRAYLRVVAVNPDASLMDSSQIYLDVYDAQGNSQASAVLSDSNLGNGSIDQNAVLGLQPGTYTIEARLNKSYSDYQLVDPTIYTATVETGKETQATVGIGGLLLKDAGVPAEVKKELKIERYTKGAWKTLIESYAVDFDRLYDLTPGRFRVIDTKAKQVLGSEFSIAPGKTVTLSLSR